MATFEIVDGRPPLFHEGITNREAPKGLGTLLREREPREYNGRKFWFWYYRAPTGYTVEITWGKETPPSLPQKNPVRCGCHAREHICSACGEPYWVEIHGMADGYCTYCYHRG